MRIKILVDRGIYKAGAVIDTPYRHAEQWVNSGFAEYVPIEVKAAAPKKEKPAGKPPKKRKAPKEPKVVAVVDEDAE